MRPALFHALLSLAAVLAGTHTVAQTQIEERVDVSRVLLDVRAVDSRGRPIPDLTPRDFEVRVDGRPASVDSVDWVPGTLPDLSRLLTEQGTGHPSEVELPRGRRIVLLFQRDLHPSRMKGLMRMRDVVAGFVEALRAEDEVALVVHDVGLKIYSDFTRDHQRVAALLSEAIVVRSEPTRPVPAAPDSLASLVDEQRAAEAASAEQALLLLARALDRLPGSKSLVYVGWSLSRREPVRETLGTALGLLIHARVTMYALDVTDADAHTLEGPLFQAAIETGGFYVKTQRFSELAMRRVSHALSGHYELSFAAPAELPAGRHEIQVTLSGRQGTAYHKRFFDD